MRTVRKSDVEKPFLAPLGEQIFEMVGRPAELGATSNHSLVHVVLPPGKRSPSHFHKLAEETYYFLSGSGSMTIDGVTFEATAGVSVTMMPGEVHQIVNDGMVDVEFLTVSAPAWVPDDTYECEMPRA